MFKCLYPQSSIKLKQLVSNIHQNIKTQTRSNFFFHNLHKNVAIYAAERNRRKFLYNFFVHKLNRRIHLVSNNFCQNKNPQINE